MTRFAANPIRRTIGGLACLVCFCCAPSAQASWLGYVNQTQSPIIIQTAIRNANGVVRVKDHKLFSGEKTWENIAVVGPVQITIMDPKDKNKIIFQQNINLANQDVLMAAQWQPQPQIPGKPPVPPAMRLIPTPIVGLPGAVILPPQQPAPPANPGPNTPIPPRAPLPPTATPPSDKPEDPNQPKTTPTSPSDEPKDAPTNRPTMPGEQPKVTPPSGQPQAPTPQPQPKGAAPAPPPPAQPKQQPKAPNRPVPPPIRPKSKGG